MANKKRNNARKRILQLHKMLGLATGVVIFIVSITGCLWTFKEEIESLYDDYRHVQPKEQEFMRPSLIREVAEGIVPDRTIHGVVYGKANDAIEVVFYEAGPEVFYQSLFLNPYSGEFIEKVDHDSGFFGFVLKGHTRLWLPEAIGSRIVSYSVLLFLIILVSGIFLWWPKNKKSRKQRFKFDWNDKTRWKRKNFDLHTVIGFYISSFGLIFAFTGCVMAFNWFYYVAYVSTGGDKAPQFITPDSISLEVVNSNTSPAYDRLIPFLHEKYGNAKSFELHYPANDSTSILVEATNTVGMYYDMDYLFFDQQTLKEIETPSIYGKYEDAKFADKVIRMNYDIHIGAIGGVVGKIIAFLTSLICASLPISGILLWYGKKYKKKHS